MPLGTRTSAFAKAASVTCIAAGLAVGILAGSLSASAAPVDCATLGATTIAPGICQILVTTSGTFTAPAGVSHLEALLVSGGSAGNNGYGGGVSGGVMYVDTLPVDTALTLTIGAGGIYAGNDATGTGYGTGGAGDGVEPLSSSLYGTDGVLPSAFVAGIAPSALFPAYSGETPVAGDGQAGDDDIDGTEPVATSQTPAGGGTNGTYVSALANTGSGGGGATLDRDSGAFTNPGNGGSGLIILRFAAPEAAVSPALAATGTDSTIAASAAGVLLLGGAAALAATTAKRRRSARA